MTVRHVDSWASGQSLSARNAGLLPCVLVGMCDPYVMTTKDVIAAKLDRLRRATPVILLQLEQSTGGGHEPTSSEGELLAVCIFSGPEAHLRVARNVGLWWRQRMAASLVSGLHSECGRRTVHAIFCLETVPTDMGALSRTVGCTREHIARELHRPRGGEGEKRSSRPSS